MPLDAAGLNGGITSIATDPPQGGPSAAAQAWADAMKDYASGIVPASTTVDAAAATLSGALATAFSSPAAAPGMESAFAAFAGTVGGGMAAAGFAPTPPASPVGFASQFAGPKPASHDDAGAQISALIDKWMKTGFGTLISPPNTVVPWT